MEDPLTMSATDAFNMLDDSQLPSFSYPDAYLDYQVPDFFNQTYLSGAHLTTTTSAGPSYPSDDTPHSALTTTSNAPLDFPKPQDDLSQFFADSPFSSPGPNQRYAPMKGQGQGYSPAWGSQPQQQDGWSNNNNNNNNNANNHINNNNNNQASGSQQQQPLAILTSGFEPGDARTVVHHGQVTPGDSPETATSPGPGKGRASTRRASRKGKESISSIATTATSATTASSSSRRNSAITAASSPLSPAPAKVKKPRKPRRSSKKPTTAEQAALKRETFLKRNREAAYKCRVKKKTQTEEVVERVKALGEDNRAKAAEVERLRREVEGLRGLLLPHYRVCGDERVVAYLDGLGAVGGAWGVGAAGRLGSLAGLGGEMGGLGLGGDESGSLSGDGRRESVGSVGTAAGSEGYNNAGGEQEMMDEEEEEDEREEQRRRESEDLEEMFKGSGSAGGGGFDSGVTPVVGDEGMVGMGGMEGMNGMGGMGAGGMEMIGGMGEGMDEVLGMGMV